MTEKQLSQRSFWIGVVTIIVSMLLFMAGGLVGVGAYTTRIVHVEEQTAVNTAEIEKIKADMPRTLYRMEYNLRTLFAKQGVEYIEVP